jgi:hypothetical protein
VALSCAPDGFDAKVLMAGVGLQGYQEVSGNMVALKGGAGFVIGKVGVRG